MKIKSKNGFHNVKFGEEVILLQPTKLIFVTDHRADWKLWKPFEALSLVLFNQRALQEQPIGVTTWGGGQEFCYEETKGRWELSALRYVKDFREFCGKNANNFRPFVYFHIKFALRISAVARSKFATRNCPKHYAQKIS